MTPIAEKSTAVDGKAFSDRRREARLKALKGATVYFNRGYGAFECVVRNQSEHGARLVFGDSAAVPAHFDLLISGENKPRQSEVRWRGASEIGVLFSEDAGKRA